MVKTFLRAGASITALCWAAGASAQTSPRPVPATDTATPADEQLADIVVTATRRSENIQNVPLAVSSFSAEQLSRSGVTDVQSLQSLAPSLTVSSSASESLGTEFRVRGVGTVGINPGLESAVATYVDGVYRNRSNVSPADLPGVERIELLRGPQGTLFGKNTSAGVVSITTRSPSFTTGGEASLTYGNRNLVEGIAGITGPVAGDVAAFRVDAAYSRADGYIDDLVVNRDYHDRNRGAVRGQLLLTPGSDVTVRLIADYSRRQETGYSPDFYRVLGPTAPALQALGGALLRGADDLRNSKTYDQRERTTQGGVSAQVDWRTPIGTLTSVTAWRAFDHRAFVDDIDHNNLDLVYVDGAYEKFRTFTQELRLQGNAGNVDYLVGGFFADERLDVLSRYKVGRDLEPYVGLLVGGAGVLQGVLNLPAGSIYPAGSGSNGDQWRQRSRSFAVFTHDTLSLTDSLRLTAGLRYTHETKRLDGTLSPVTNPACQAFIARNLFAVPQLAGLASVTCIPNFDPRFNGSYRDSKDENQLSGVASIAYTVSNRVNAYASYSRGYKAGGYNLDRAGFRNPLTAGAPTASQLSFQPEKVDAFELGLKLAIPEARLRINTALFLSQFHDFQLTYNTGAGLVTTNVDSARTRGVEIESSWVPIRHVDTSLAVTYSVAEYRRIGGASDPAIVALAGTRLPNAPTWTVVGSLSYSGELSSSLDWFAYADGRYQSRQQTDELGAAEGFQSAYATAGARLGIGRRDKGWGLEVWARNITDKRAFQYSSPALFQPGSYVGIIIEPRTFGATLRGRF